VDAGVAQGNNGSMGDPAEPIRPDELEGLFARFFASPAPERAALAVSGGSDSTALMVLFADWLAQVDKPADAFTVLTVDHGLRPESAEEARAVGVRATSLGFRDAVLAWEGPKPGTGLQAAARAARYRLLAEHARAHGISLLLTGHTADDQAETLLMRLARGSGLDGLSAMSPLTSIAPRGPDGVQALRLGRPLLEVRKARLQATLEQRAIPWFEDPSNERLAFERTRLRAARRQLEALGLTTDMLVLSARRLQRARAALEHWVAEFCAPDKARFAIDPCGFIRIDAPALRRLPGEIAVRVLSRAVALAGGSEEPVALANIETIVDALCSGPGTGAWTLARAKISATDNRVLIEREPGRESLPTLTLEPGSEALWDGRFLVIAGARLGGTVTVRALGMEGVRQVRGAVAPPPGLPVGALRALPGFWRGARLIAAPNLSFWTEDSARREISATFTALGNYNSERD
jgi:tRNA(Ile)-lysidine synthase